MQRINRKKYPDYNNQSEQNIYSTLKIIPNGNTNAETTKKSVINNTNYVKRSNKFLSIKERQKIIREINNSQNKFNPSNLPSQRLNTEKINSNSNKNILYVKKRNYLISRSNEKISKNVENKKLVNGINNTKKGEQKILVNKNIQSKGKYKKHFLQMSNVDIKTPKNIVKNKDLNKEFFFSNGDKNENQNQKTIIKEIYKKPINGKTNNKISVNLNRAYKLVKKKPKNNNTINITNINIKNSAQKEKVDCFNIIKSDF